MTRPRLDWVEFLRRTPHPHGVRIRLANFDASTPEGLRTEKRLVRIVRARSVREPFALRRSYTPGPTVIECVFRTAAEADDLAKAVNAAPIKPPVGWATARELVADNRAVRQLLKLGAEPWHPDFTNPPRNDGPPPAAPSVTPSTRAYVAASKPNPVTEARSRLAQMSPEEQAAALFDAMRQP